MLAKLAGKEPQPPCSPALVDLANGSQSVMHFLKEICHTRQMPLEMHVNLELAQKAKKGNDDA